MIVVRRWGDRQYPADRLDPMLLPVFINEFDHGLDRRSSSAAAKYADALRRMSLACRSSRFSRSSALIFSATSDGTPARTPLLTSDLFTHSCSVGALQPIFAATEQTAAHRDGYSCACSRTSRTARSRTSGENFLFASRLMTPPSQGLEPPANPGRFRPSLSQYCPQPV